LTWRATERYVTAGVTRPHLIPDEIEMLRMLAGQIPRRNGSRQMICVLELAAFGLCLSSKSYRLTRKGVECLEVVTGTIDLRSRRLDWSLL
jgi:hypothetical protein